MSKIGNKEWIQIKEYIKSSPSQKIMLSPHNIKKISDIIERDNSNQDGWYVKLKKFLKEGDKK